MAVEPNRWGIIYSPMAGTQKVHRRWNKIKEYLEQKRVEFDYIQSEGYGSVERLSEMLANVGYSTLVIVGGDGALQDAINGIMASPNRGKVALGIIPNGISNNFADYWGLTATDFRHAVDCIIARRVRPIDVGCCSYITEGEHIKRYFLNVVNIGLSARAVEIFNRQGRLAKTISLLLSGFQLLFRRTKYRMTLKINNERIDDRFMTICIGNSRGFGLTPSAVPYNGWLDVSLIYCPEFFGMVQGLFMLLRGHLLNHKIVRPYRTRRVKVTGVEGARAGIDGRVFTPSYPMEITVLPEVLQMIIP